MSPTEHGRNVDLDLSIVIATHQRAADLRRTLESMARCDAGTHTTSSTCQGLDCSGAYEQADPDCLANIHVCADEYLVTGVYAGPLSNLAGPSHASCDGGQHSDWLVGDG